MALVMGFGPDETVSSVGTITLTNSGGTTPTVASGYSLDSLKTRQLGDICRINPSVGGITIIRIDFSETTTFPMACGVLGAAGVQFNVTFKTFFTTVARTTSPEYTVAPGIAWLTAAGDIHALPAGSINRLEVWIDPNTTGTIDIGRIWYSKAFHSAYSSGMAWDTGPEDSGGVELSRGGQAYPRIGVVSRTVRLPMPHLSPAEIFGPSYNGAFGAFTGIGFEQGVHSVGKTGELFAFQENSTLTARPNPMRPLYGHFQEMPRFTAKAPCVYETSLVMREER